VIQPVKSQEEFKGKYIFSEFGGPGVIFSVNFDSRFKNQERLGLGYRVGLGFGLGSFEKKTQLTHEWLSIETMTKTYY
jgi:hypothetical protein